MASRCLRAGAPTRDCRPTDMPSAYPNGAEFAFTILDDTDDTTLRNGPPVYALLRDHGLRTTKTVWAIDVPVEERGIYHAGETLETPGYLEWVCQLEREGFEIAFHNASMASSRRETTIRALDTLQRTLMRPVQLHCNHGQNRENLFWGAARYRTAPLRWLAQFRHGVWRESHFQGEHEDSPYYWADIANERLRYLRSMAFAQLDGSRIPPGRPFQDPHRLSTPIFFNTADAPDCDAFTRLVTPRSLDALRRRGGWAIVSTHLGKGFCRNGEVDTRFHKAVEHLATLPGWFVPVSELLDHLVVRDGHAPLGPLAQLRMEGQHVLDRLLAW
jgi:hypothetical protein